MIDVYEYQSGNYLCKRCYLTVNEKGCTRANCPVREECNKQMADEQDPSVSDGSTATYYELPEGVTELYQLQNYKNMNLNIGTIFSECYRYGEASHANELRGINKILAYATFEKERLEKLNAML